VREEFGLWRPLSLADTLRDAVRRPAARVLLLAWLLATALCIALGVYQVKFAWNALPVHIGPIHFSVTVYPPLVICIWMLFWLGFEWAFISAYLATLWLALYNGMSLEAALVFALVDPLALALYALAYRTVRISFDLRSLPSAIWFVFVSFVAAVAGSAGSFIWSQEHNLSAVDTFGIWQGWWTGGLFQAILLDAPVLAIAARHLERLKSRYFTVAETPETSRRWIFATILAGGLVLAGFLMATGQTASSRLEHAIAVGLSPQTRTAIADAAYSWKLAVWTGMLLTLAGSMGGIFLAYIWNHSLFREVKLRTDELMDSEQRFRVTFDQAAVGIAHLAPNGRWLRVNQKLCDIVGYQREELLRGLTFQDITHPDDLDADLALAKRILDGEIETYSMTKRYIRKNESCVWANLTVSLARGTHGEPRYFISIIEDITNRKQLEEQLGQSQKMEAVGRLAGGVAHDFNNLLTVISGYGSLMLAQVQEGDPLRDQAEAICKAADRAASLTSQLLAFSRKQIVQPKILDLGELVMGMEGMLHRLLGETVALTTAIHPRRGIVKADPGQLEQVIVNLAVNARDAMPAGGNLLIEVCDETSDGAEQVILAVRDTGTGMDAEVQSHLFEPFFTTKPLGKGTGLGLSIVYGIVKQNGGSIRVRSQEGSGSSFEILLPRVFDAPAKSVDLPAIEKGATGSETVLLVEDETTLRQLAAGILRSSGYQVMEAASAEEALDLWSRTRCGIHLLVSDMIMPGMNGRALAERLRESAPELRVLYISGYTENILDLHGPLSGTTGFLQKPFHPGVLTRRVRELLDTVV
jgi:PAS domain S-box-containing protein